MSRHIRNKKHAKPKTKVQISCTVTAQLICTFVFISWIVQSLFFLFLKFQTSGLLRPVFVKNSICWYSHAKAQISLVMSTRVTSSIHRIFNQCLQCTSSYKCHAEYIKMLQSLLQLFSYRRHTEVKIHIGKQVQIPCYTTAFELPGVRCIRLVLMSTL